MTYEDYKQLLIVQGMTCMARYVGTGVETGCAMFNINNGLTIEISISDERILAKASVIIRGLMDPVSTCEFSQPWSNTAFKTQCDRLIRLKQIIGDHLIDR